jgi:hypothetical protein
VKESIVEAGRPERLGAFLSCSGTTLTHAFEGSSLVIKTLWNVLEVTSVGEVLCPGIDAKGEITGQPSARVAAEQIGRRLARATGRKGTTDA